MPANISHLSLASQFNERSSKAIAHIFEEKMQIPVPKGQQYYETQDGRFLVFMSQTGLVLNIHNTKQAITFKHDHLIAPLFTYKDTDADIFIDVLPGVDREKAQRNAQRKPNIFQKYVYGYKGLVTLDNLDQNYAYLPKTNHSLYIDLDKDAVELDKTLWGKATNYVYKTTAQSTQHKYYLPLKIYGALLEKSKNNDCFRRNFKEFVKLSCVFKSQGKLLSQWEDIDYRDISDAALAYENECRPYI